LIAFVLDASVAAKCVLPSQDEPLVLEAARLLSAYESREVSFIVPDIFWAELGNVLWNAVRRKRTTRAAAESALGLMLARGFPTLPTAPLLPTALAMAIAHDCAVYDCLYVTLASTTGIDLITADERLANSLSPHLPVKWLGTL